MADARPSTTHAMRVGIDIRHCFSVIEYTPNTSYPSPKYEKRVSAGSTGRIKYAACF